MPELTEKQVTTDIMNLRRFWKQRNDKFKEWYEILTLIDLLKTSGMESYVSNEPETFYNMSHYLLTKGEISHTTPIESESAIELDRRARVHRGCQHMWKLIDHERQLGGGQPFVDELGFYLLVLGWYGTVISFNKDSGQVQAQLWNPHDAYPKYVGGRIVACSHSYDLSGEEAIAKAEANNWNYTPRGAIPAKVTLDDYFIYQDGVLHNMILIDAHDVTGWVDRPEMKLLVAPVGGFPDRGSLTRKGGDWRKLLGRGIFEVNAGVTLSFNKWKSQVSQILRDTSNPITQEFSASPQATPEQLRERGALFHYAVGEGGLLRVPPPAIPIEIQANLLELRREMQKGSFNDAVYGMVEGQPGYALSLLASSSANQILYPYMDGKHFVISECDKFWLSNLKTSKKVFDIKGKFIEKLKPTDIPEDVTIEVESTVATPKDWLERGTIANMLKDQLDDATIITEIFGMNDPQAIKRRKSLDRMLEHPMSQMVEMIAGYYAHADYLEHRGDARQAALFRRAAEALEGQLGVPPAGAGKPAEAAGVEAAREAGTPAEKPRVSPAIAPPETRGFTPAQLRQSIGKGSLIRR
jgi:hypothetical protein